MNPAPPLISMVTTCKARLNYLRESIETWLDLDYPDYEIVVVDYDCPDNTAAFVRNRRDKWLRNSRVRDIRVVKVSGKPVFNLNDARNRGVRMVRGKLVLMIDADVRIQNASLLGWMADHYRNGKVFFSNLALLHTGFREGHRFYRCKYELKSIRYHSILPFTGKQVGLSGTAAFCRDVYSLCGAFRREINDSGWGSDDMEFYLRYLNYIYSRNPFEWNIHAAEKPDQALDQVLAHSISFPDGSFRLIENTPEEKSRFYPLKINESRKVNRNFIRELLGESKNPRGWFPRKPGASGIPISVFDHPRRETLNLPKWFQGFYFFWRGRILYGHGQRDESEKAFQRVLESPGKGRVDHEVQAWLFIARIRKEQGAPAWEKHVRSGLRLFARKQKELFPMKDFSRYNLASLLKYFQIPEARDLFMELAEGAENRDLRSGAYFHLGEMALQKGDRNRARDCFGQALRINPDHGRANEYLEKLE